MAQSSDPSPYPDSSDIDIGPPITAVLQNPSATQLPVEEDGDGGVAGALGDDLSLYQLKWVEWKGGFAPIVTQNDNGPCPLLALCNVLILSGRMKISPGETIVTSTTLLGLLAACLLENTPKDLSEGECANYEQNVQDAMTVFPKLQTGLDVNVKFDSVSGFEFTSESGLFDLVDVSLYHGWLADPQDPASFHIVSSCSYNKLVERVITDRASSDSQKVHDALIAEQWLEVTASQLTYHGLCELNSTVREGQLCIFFRNNHFSTMLKRKNQLLLLVTDHGFLNELGYVWEVLSDIDGDGEFLDAQFRWSVHSESQRRRERQQQATPTPEKEREEDRPVTTGLDYHIALSLQQEEEDPPAHRNTSSTPTPSPQHTAHLSDHELAMQLQKAEAPPSTHTPSPPPSSREEYEQAAAQHRGKRRKETSDCLLI